MYKVILAPDSFKGTLSSVDICRLMERAITSHFPDCEVRSIPVADGGEGTVDCFIYALGGERIEMTVTGPLGDPTPSFYAVMPDGAAIIEMAAAAGLPLVEGRPDPLTASTYGVGELMADALKRGCRKIILGLGGSATNDGGCGMAVALGAKFYGADGKSFIPAGGTLKDIARIDLSGFLPALKDCDISAMCDINNPLYGPEGAAYVFGPQKGADEDMIRFLDAGLKNLAGVIKTDLHMDVANLPGAGAAGGFGAGVAAFLGGRLTPGTQTVLDITGFDALLEGADMVLTGEGRIDSQSIRGKVVCGVAERAKTRGVPVFAIVGDILGDMGPVYQSGVTAVLSTNRRALPFEQARLSAGQDLALTVDGLMRVIRAGVR